MRFPENPEFMDMVVVGTRTYMWDGQKWQVMEFPPEEMIFKSNKPVTVKDEIGVGTDRFVTYGFEFDKLKKNAPLFEVYVGIDTDSVSTLPTFTFNGETTFSVTRGCRYVFYPPTVTYDGKEFSLVFHDFSNLGDVTSPWSLVDTDLYIYNTGVIYEEDMVTMNVPMNAPDFIHYGIGYDELHIKFLIVTDRHK